MFWELIKFCIASEYMTICGIHLGPEKDLHLRIKIGKQVWISEKAEAGFDDGTYGWCYSSGEIICKEVPIILDTRAIVELVAVDKSGKDEMLETTLIHLFHKLDDDSIVVSERHVGLFLGDSDPDACFLEFYVFSDPSTLPPFDFDSRTLEKPIPPGAWFDVPRRIEPAMEFSNGSGKSFKLSIDGLRFLPENCSITRIRCQILTNELIQLDSFELVDALPNMDSPVYFPEFTNTFTFKMPASNPNATLTAVIKIFTIDRFLKQLVTIGAAYFNIFINEKMEPPDSFDVRPMYLNEGYHQIPVFLTGDKPLPHSNIFSQVKARVPCCSLLLRLSHADALPPTSYSNLVYFSQVSRPLPYEMNLFYYIMKERPLIDIKTSLALLKQDIKAANDEAMISWMGKRVAKEKGFLQGVDLSCCVRYHEGWCFKFSIECAESLKSKAFSIAIVSLFPPGTLYENVVRRRSFTKIPFEDIMYNKKLDFSSTIRSPVWQDGLMVSNCYFTSQTTYPCHSVVSKSSVSSKADSGG
ncbi:hypothetical protein BC830DRAFT_186350 [Chytriomyces sp. MP71]|nr:hypothetical protein BC830DRAFT_186350 [Chytriomyces sp. MP71]